MCKDAQNIDCRKRDYRFVRTLANQFPKMIEADVRFFYTRKNGITFFDFEPAALNQHIETTLEIIRV